MFWVNPAMCQIGAALKYVTPIAADSEIEILPLCLPACGRRLFKRTGIHRVYARQYRAKWQDCDR